MLKQELKYHFKRIRIVYILLLSIFLLLSIYTSRDVALLVSFYQVDAAAWTDFITYYYQHMCTPTIFFIIIASFYYILRITLDYQQGKTRWLLLAYMQKKRVLADFLMLSMITLSFYILSYALMFFLHQYFVSLLDPLEISYIPTHYQSFSYMLSLYDSKLFQILYPHNVIGFIKLIGIFLSFILGETYVLHILKNDATIKEALLVIAYIVLMTIGFGAHDSNLLIFMISILFSFLFATRLKVVYVYGRSNLC